MEKGAGVRYVKFDLHIHTPASDDFIVNSELSQEQAYLDILDNAIEQEIEIIAITDHNSFDGYNKIQSILSSNTKLKDKYQRLLILCGIEITCFSKHLLAIFDEHFLGDKQKKFLEEIGLSYGYNDAMADLFGPALLIEKISQYGGIAVLAHADKQSGFLHYACNSSTKEESELNFSGKSLAKIVTSPHLYGMQVSNSRNTAKIKLFLQNKDYCRQLPLAFLSFSDCHGNGAGKYYTGKNGTYIGATYSVAKLSYVSFDALKMALSDPDSRIVDETSKQAGTYIIGCAIESPIIKGETEKYCFIRFNSEMNCIIGARGTGKSTILDIVGHIMSGSNPEITQRFTTAVLFVRTNKQVFVISMESKSEIDSYTGEVNPHTITKIYKQQGEKFISITSKAPTELKTFITVGYRQKQLHEYSRDPNMILEIVDDFIKWQNGTEFEKLQSQIQYNEEKLKEELQTHYASALDEKQEFVKYLKSHNLFSEISKKHKIILQNISALHTLREKMVAQLNILLSGKVKLSLSFRMQGQDFCYYTGRDTKQFSGKVKIKSGKSYDDIVQISKFLKRIIEFGAFKGNFDFFKLLMEGDFQKIIEDYNLKSIKNCENDLKNIRKCITPDELMLMMCSSIKLEYNINTGISKTKKYNSSRHLSMGQHAVALLLLILNASYDLSDNRPLLMDQPEDDLDNSYIYNTLVSEFRRSKSKRQIIISSHNANIPVASDAENIIMLKYEGTAGYVELNGALDKPIVADGVLETLEGGKEALQKRNSKYKSYII